MAILTGVRWYLTVVLIYISLIMSNVEQGMAFFKRILDCYLEKAMATHSSTLAWKIPWTEESGRLQSMGSLRVGHDWATSLSLFTFMHWRRKWQPTPVFLPGESQGRGACWAAVYGVVQSRTRLKRLSSSSSRLLLPRGGNGNTLQHSCLENPTDRGAWWATVCGVTKSWTQLEWLRIQAVINKRLLYKGMYIFLFSSYIFFLCLSTFIFFLHFPPVEKTDFIEVSFQEKSSGP